MSHSSSRASGNSISRDPNTPASQRDDAARTAGEPFASRSAAISPAVLDALPAHIAVLDTRGTIIAVNAAWRTFAQQNGLTDPHAGIGANYLEVCTAATGPEHRQAQSIAAGLRRVMAGEQDDFREEYSCHAPHEQRWFRFAATPFTQNGRIEGVVVAHLNITERVLALQSARATADHYRLLFRKNPLPMWVFDSETLCFLAVNEAAVRNYGYTENEFLGLTLYDIRPPEDIPALDHILLDQGDRPATDLPTRHRRKNGEIIPVEITANAIDFAGRPARLVLARDVSAEHRMDLARRESEQRFRLVARAAGDAIWDHDLATGTVWWSEGLNKLFGFAHTTTPESWWLQQIHPDERDRVLAGLEHALASPAEQWEDCYRFLRADGVYADVRDRGCIVRDDAGRAIRLVGVIADETERRRAVEKIAEQAALIDEAQDAIILTSLDDRIQYWNKGAERLYGWSRAEALGRRSAELLYRDPAEFADGLRHVFTHGVWQAETKKHTRDEREIIVQVRWTLIRDATERPTSILAINTDVTEHRRIEAQFFRAQRLESIGTLAAGIAHDFNNVLAPMVMALALLRSKSADPECHRLIDLLETSAQRGANLVKQVLAFGRGIDGERIPIRARHLAREIEQIVADTFPKSIEFELRCDPELAEIVGDPTQLHQVMLNLCVNARDAMPRGGRLVLALENVLLDPTAAAALPGARPGNYVRLRVQDTGSGIAAHLREKIFEPFFTTKETGRGSGLGLSTVVAIARSHGGFMHLTSEEGRGSTFDVFFPVAATPAAAGEVHGPAPALPRGSGELVLVVDDEAPIREVARQALENFGYRVAIAAHGAEAMSRYAQHPHLFAAVVLDTAMPVMDGPATLSALRSINPSVRVIIASGQADDETNWADLSANDADIAFLRKPYTAELLIRTLHHLLLGRATPSPSTP